MLVEYKTGNLLNSDANALVNAVNRRGFMGAGIALAFKNKFPEMYESYKQLCAEGAYKDSQITFYTYPKNKFNGVCIINLQTVDDNLVGQYSLIKEGLQQLANQVQQDNMKTIAIPPLGCGIGGLDKKIVHNMIIDAFADVKVTLYLYNFNED